MKTLSQHTTKFAKTWPLAAGCAAQLLMMDGVLADSYSVNILPGSNFIANQLANGNNTVAGIMPTVPEGTEVYLWDCTINDYIQVGTFTDGTWVGEGTTLSLTPGNGIALVSPEAFTLTFTGVRTASPRPRVLTPGGWHLLGMQTPDPGTPEGIVGATLESYPTFYRYNPAKKLYYRLNLAEPLPIGESVYFKVSHLVCPADIVVPADPGQCSARVFYSETCGAVVDPPSGSVFPKGTTTVTCVVADAAGNPQACSFNVTVVDKEPPQLVCGDIAVGNDPGQCSARVFYALAAASTSGFTLDQGLADRTTRSAMISSAGAVVAFPGPIAIAPVPTTPTVHQIVATDNCGGVNVVFDPPSGSTFPKGISTVKCTATDDSGNSTTCSFAVTVQDREAPVAACIPTTNPAGGTIPKAGDNPKSGQNPDGFYQLVATDNCDSSPKIYVKDSASGFVAGPFQSGDKVKVTQAPGVTPSSKPMAGVIVTHLQLKGDALVYGVDAAGNQSQLASCLVAPPPK